MRNLMRSIATTIISCAFICSGPAYSQVIQGETIGSEWRGQWSSYGLKLGSEFNYRASTIGTDGSTTLVLDMEPKTCASLLSVIFPYNTVLERDIPAFKVLIDARIDSGEVFYLNGNYSGTMGDKFGIIWLDATDRYYEILRMMRAGNVMRVKIQHLNGEYIDTVSFSLSGFTYSSNRIKSVCDKASAPEPPRQTQRPNPTMGDAFLRNL